MNEAIFSMHTFSFFGEEMFRRSFHSAARSTLLAMFPHLAVADLFPADHCQLHDVILVLSVESKSYAPGFNPLSAV